MKLLLHFVVICFALQIAYQYVSVEARALDAFKDVAMKVTNSVADQADKTPDGMSYLSSWFKTGLYSIAN